MDILSSSLPSSDESSPWRPAIAVAIDKSKNSQQTFKWAVDHLLFGDTKSIVPIHVRSPKVDGPVKTGRSSGSEWKIVQEDAEAAEIFLPYRALCARKDLQMKKVVLEGWDVPRAIVDYVVANRIQSVVLGANNRNALMRFLNPDIPTCLMKGLPDWCGVYVIYKGKLLTSRTAKVRPAAAKVDDVPPRRSLQLDPTPSQSLPQLDCSVGQFDTRSMHSTPRESSIAPVRFRHLRSISGEDVDLARKMDESELGNEESCPSRTSFSSAVPVRDQGGRRSAGDELRRLRLELKQTTEMCNAALKEAIMAQDEAEELQRMKIEEVRKVESVRQSEETALALAAVEKSKCKAALEVADAAQRIAELEVKRRLKAESKARSRAAAKEQHQSLLRSDLRCRSYSIDEIEVATSFFSPSLKIGEGGYGPVFRGVLDHTPVAVKILRPDAAQGRRQFQQEVEILSSIRHPNMVLLLGACPEYGCLVYEYMDYGSLEDRLFRRGNTPPIPWPARFKIAVEIATALLFLHQAKPEPLVHRDLKPANILLDRNYVSKIGDVGLARLVPAAVADDVTQCRMTSAAGTMCYIDPEYQQSGMLCVQSDVYSLGVLLLQIITARGPMGLTRHVELAVERGALAEMLDGSVTDWPAEEAISFAKLALKCAELRRKDRPDLSKAVLPELSRLSRIGQEFEAKRFKLFDGDVGAIPNTLRGASNAPPLCK
ncbi:U-box domain-containing protein 35-like [Zingiber officinale]|uniref:U-box domain-containing protein 35-like n=1 Tax=Zingiber officinale TaxID=94328 RepID=UPI001C4BA3C8|nr:U-box domain-containing protein 35-like [Zingiber officinale]